jgi:hypothetical protein
MGEGSRESVAKPQLRDLKFLAFNPVHPAVFVRDPA